MTVQTHHDRLGRVPGDPWGAAGPATIAYEDRQHDADAAVAARSADHGDGARNGLPLTATPAGRHKAHIEDGLYVHGTGDPALRPDVPAEADAFDAPPLPYTPTRRPKADR